MYNEVAHGHSVMCKRKGENMKLRNCDDSLNMRKGELANEMFGDTYINIPDGHKLTVLHQIIWELINDQKVREHIDSVLPDEPTNCQLGKPKWVIK